MLWGDERMKSGFNENVGNRIREKRKLLNLSREKFAEMIDLSPQFLAEIETGRKGMSSMTLLKICNGLCVSADYILTGNSGGDSSEIVGMLSTLNEHQTAQAGELLRVFVTAINSVQNS